MVFIVRESNQERSCQPKGSQWADRTRGYQGCQAVYGGGQVETAGEVYGK